MSDETKKNIHPDDYTLEDLGWSRVPTWMEGKTLYDMISLKGKTVMVTGSGGIGLGRDIAHSLAGLGAEVVWLTFWSLFTKRQKTLLQNGELKLIHLFAT